MWPAIKSAIPDATLNVYSDINGKWVNEVSKEQMDEIRRILGTNCLPGVTMHGWVSKQELATAWSRADIWLYPCIFQETFCLTALEAAATKTLAIGTPLAALGETIGDRGLLIDGNPMTTEWQDRALKGLLAVIGDSRRKEELIERNYKWACNMSWRERGEEFSKLYLGDYTISGDDSIKKDNTISVDDSSKKMNINYAEMLNWTHDLPTGENSKEKFLEALARANPKRILEIGTFAGTSLIEMLKLYPDAKGVAIDSWKNYDEDGIEPFLKVEENNIEKVFYENIIKAGMSERVAALKGDSVERLASLIRTGDRFDFIYIDGSHACLDCYADMVMAWNLLNKNAVS